MASGWPLLFSFYKGSVAHAGIDGASGPSLQSGIRGVTERTDRFRLPSEFGVFGAVLQPTAIGPLFGIPSSALANETLDLRHLTGSEGRRLEEELAACACDEERARVLSDFITAGLCNVSHDSSILSRAVGHVVQSRGLVRVPKLADTHCYSTRTFERKFKEHSGLSPKVYANIVRFQSALDELATGESSLTEIAYRGGFYDQPHFTNDFTRYSGFNPRSFTTSNPGADPLWLDFVAFFQFLSWCPPVLCFRK
jgi:AraC-like DNA-binding protein